MTNRKNKRSLRHLITLLLASATMTTGMLYRMQEVRLKNTQDELIRVLSERDALQTQATVLEKRHRETVRYFLGRLNQHQVTGEFEERVIRNMEERLRAYEAAYPEPAGGRHSEPGVVTSTAK